MRALGIQSHGASYFCNINLSAGLITAKRLHRAQQESHGFARAVLNFNVELMFCVNPHRVSFGGG